MTKLKDCHPPLHTGVFQFLILNMEIEMLTSLKKWMQLLTQTI